jgi:hypothetical protein
MGKQFKKHRGRSTHRGKSKGRFNNSKNKGTTTFEKEYKFAPQTNPVSTTKYATFQSTKEVLISHIQKNFDEAQDVATSIEEMKIVDLTPHRPVLGRPNADPAADKVAYLIWN